MFVFGLILIILSLILGHYAKGIKTTKSVTERISATELRRADVPDKDKEDLKKYAGWARLGILAFGAFFIALSFFTIIQPGQIGIQKFFGKLQPGILTEGIAVKNPLASVTHMSVKTQTFHMVPGAKGDDIATKSLSSDNMEISIDSTSYVRLTVEGAAEILRNIGDEDIYNVDRTVPTLRGALRNVASRHTAMELMSGMREKVGDEVSAEANRLFKEYFTERKIPVGLICEQCVIRDIEPPKPIKDAIEDKLAQEQLRDKKQYEIATAEGEAKRKVVEAQGLADAQKIIDKTLTPEYLQWKYIEVLGTLVNAPNHSTLILPFDQKLTPMLNIGNNGQPLVTRTK
jgi:prohibitin 1